MSELEARQRRHVFYSWAAQGAVRGLELVEAKGATFRLARAPEVEVLDFESQAYNVNLGHGDPRVAQAIARQAGELAAASPRAVFEAKARIGELLADKTPGDLAKSFLCLGGADAIENAVKMAKLLTGRHKVVARYRSYHGATMGALTLTADPRRRPFEPGVPGLVRVMAPYRHRCRFCQPSGVGPAPCNEGCVDHIEEVVALEGPETIAAIVMESIGGANGVIVPPPSWWPRLRALCDRHGILLIADEVLTGFGRTGRWFGIDHYGVTPDMMCLAKGLTSGYAPLGAVVVREHLAAGFDQRLLSCGLTTYGHPVSCAAAVACVEAYEEDGLVAHAAEVGAHLGALLEGLRASVPHVSDVRGKGLLWCVELSDPRTGRPLTPHQAAVAPDNPLSGLATTLLERGLYLPIKWNFAIFAPPLVVTKAQCERALAIFQRTLEEVLP